MLPQRLAAPLKDHLGRVKTRHDADLEAVYGDVYLPDASPVSSQTCHGSGVAVCVPPRTRSVDPRSRVVRWHHADETALQRAMQQAVRRAGVATLPAG